LANKAAAKKIGFYLVENMPSNYQTIEYTDELLAGQTVCRRYQNGRVEWRKRIDETKAEWRDNQSNQGIDELLGDGIVKRTYANGQILYAREQGYGRTLWSNNLLTVNRTSFGGKVGAILAGIGGAFLLGGLVAPPLMLAAEQEEQLRQQQALQQQSAGSSSSSGDSGSSWDDGSDFGDSDGDFG
jgi:hypothetical protein